MDLKLWWFALQKPVKENDKRVWDSFDVIAKWLISTRATVTQLTLMAGVIAGLLAYRDGFFDFLPWLLMTLGIYFAHSSENLVNDYIDFTRGIDEDNYYRGQYGIHPLVHKFWTKQDWTRWFLTAGAIAVRPSGASVAVAVAASVVGAAGRSIRSRIPRACRRETRPSTRCPSRRS